MIQIIENLTNVPSCQKIVIFIQMQFSIVLNVENLMPRLSRRNEFKIQFFLLNFMD